MKKLLITILCLTISLNLVAEELETLIIDDSPFKNMREGKSQLMTPNKDEEIRRLYQRSPDLEILKGIMADKNLNRCASKVIGAMKRELGLARDKDLEMAILALRQNDYIDDVSAGILIKATNMTSSVAHNIAKDTLTANDEEKVLALYKEKVADLENTNLCKEDTFRSLIGKLREGSPNFVKNLKHINKLALDNGLIKNETFQRLEDLRIKKVHEWPLTLGVYKQSLESITKSFSGRKKQASKLVTERGRFKNKISLRQGLYEKFNATQIIMLANIVKSLKKRLDSKDIAVHINYVDQDSEIINLTPMEKFRFILKLLRKELATINNGTILNGVQANYIDIITAAYEVGYISADEIEQFAKLEEIWNPKITTKQKVMLWTKMFGGVASILLPPPFGFVSVMAIMLIDQQIKDAPVDPDTEYNLL